MSTAALNSQEKHTVRLKEGAQLQAFEVTKNEFLIGRDEKADIRPSHTDVSSRHAAIRIAHGQVFVRDLGSTNGTFVAGKRLQPHQEVALSGAGEEIQLGKAASVFVAAGPQPAIKAGPALSIVKPAPAPAPSLEAARHEVDAFKKKAIAEIEAIQAEAVRFAESIIKESKEEGRRDAEALRKDAYRDNEILLEQGRREAESMKESAHREAETLRTEAHREAESARTEAHREAETLRTEAHREAESARTEARREADTLREQAQKNAESLKDEARRDAEVFRAQAQKAFEMLRSEFEKLRQEGDRIKGDCEALKTEYERLKGETDKSKNEYHTEAGRLAVLRKELDFHAKQATLQKTQAETASRELTQRREALTQECAELSRKTQALAAEREAAAREHAQLERSLLDTRQTLERVQTESQAHLEALKRRIEQEEKRLATAQERALDAKSALKAEEDALKAAQGQTQREREVQQAEERKRHAHYEALDAEYKVKQLSLEKSIGEAEVKRLEAERCVQNLLSRQSDIQRETDKRQLEADQHVAAATERMLSLENDAQKAREKMERFQQESERLQAIIQEQELAKQETAAAQHALAQAQGALADFRKRSEGEMAELRAQLDQEAKSGREQLKVDITLLRQAAQDEMDQLTEKHKEALKLDFAEKGKAMARELADAKLKELKIIHQMQDEERKASRLRFRATLDEIVAKAVELSRQKPLEQAVPELQEAVKSALEGRTAATRSAEADERSRKYWKKMALRASIPIGAALFYALFPGVPGMIRDRFSRTVDSEKNDSGVFLDQIKQRGMKFQPDMDHSYRATYGDNILYLDGYVEMKLSDKEQKDWTLILNDFIVGRLGLSDRVIPDFMSIETVLIQDLLHIREGIVPQFKEQGFARMAETEKAAQAKLTQLLQSPENYQKFRGLEKDYYDSFLKRRKAGVKQTGL